MPTANSSKDAARERQRSRFLRKAWGDAIINNDLQQGRKNILRQIKQQSNALQSPPEVE